MRNIYIIALVLLVFGCLRRAPVEDVRSNQRSYSLDAAVADRDPNAPHLDLVYPPNILPHEFAPGIQFPVIELAPRLAYVGGDGTLKQDLMVQYEICTVATAKEAPTCIKGETDRATTMVPFAGSRVQVTSSLCKVKFDAEAVSRVCTTPDEQTLDLTFHKANERDLQIARVFQTRAAAEQVVRSKALDLHFVISHYLKMIGRCSAIDAKDERVAKLQALVKLSPREIENDLLQTDNSTLFTSVEEATEAYMKAESEDEGDDTLKKVEKTVGEVVTVVAAGVTAVVAIVEIYEAWKIWHLTKKLHTIKINGDEVQLARHYETGNLVEPRYANMPYAEIKAQNAKALLGNADHIHLYIDDPFTRAPLMGANGQYVDFDLRANGIGQSSGRFYLVDDEGRWLYSENGVSIDEYRVGDGNSVARRNISKEVSPKKRVFWDVPVEVYPVRKIGQAGVGLGDIDPDIKFWTKKGFESFARNHGLNKYGPLYHDNVNLHPLDKSILIEDPFLAQSIGKIRRAAPVVKAVKGIARVVVGLILVGSLVVTLNLAADPTCSFEELNGKAKALMDIIKVQKAQIARSAQKIANE